MTTSDTKRRLYQATTYNSKTLDIGNIISCLLWAIWDIRLIFKIIDQKINVVKATSIKMIRIVTVQMLILVQRTFSTYCGAPGHPSGGSVLLPRSESDRSRYFETGTVVKYSCNKGRIMFGTGVRECLENGSWSSTIPICSK